MNAYHIGIYVGDGRTMHSAGAYHNNDGGVVIEKIHPSIIPDISFIARPRLTDSKSFQIEIPDDKVARDDTLTLSVASANGARSDGKSWQVKIIDNDGGAGKKVVGFYKHPSDSDDRLSRAEDNDGDKFSADKQAEDTEHGQSAHAQHEAPHSDYLLYEEPALVLSHAEPESATAPAIDVVSHAPADAAASLSLKHLSALAKEALGLPQTAQFERHDGEAVHEKVAAESPLAVQEEISLESLLQDAEVHSLPFVAEDAAHAKPMSPTAQRESYAVEPTSVACLDEMELHAVL